MQAAKSQPARQAKPAIDYDASGDLHRMLWVLEEGSAPMRRIFSTLKHLRSQLTYQQVDAMVAYYLKQGIIKAEPHPLHEGQFFYSRVIQSN